MSTMNFHVQLPPVDQKRNKETEDILNSILPPRECVAFPIDHCYWGVLIELLSCMRFRYTENGQLWIQNVSAAPATRLDVITLQVSYMQLLFSVFGCLL